jgi:hypothetical protein
VTILMCVRRRCGCGRRLYTTKRKDEAVGIATGKEVLLDLCENMVPMPMPIVVLILVLMLRSYVVCC